MCSEYPPDGNRQNSIHIVTMTVGGMESKVTDNKVVILTAASPANKSKKGGTHP